MAGYSSPNRSTFADRERATIRALVVSSGLLISENERSQIVRWSEGDWVTPDRPAARGASSRFATVRVGCGVGLIRLGRWLQGNAPSGGVSNDSNLPV